MKEMKQCVSVTRRRDQDLLECGWCGVRGQAGGGGSEGKPQGEGSGFSCLMFGRWGSLSMGMTDDGGV